MAIYANKSNVDGGQKKGFFYFFNVFFYVESKSAIRFWGSDLLFEISLAKVAIIFLRARPLHCFTTKVSLHFWMRSRRNFMKWKQLLMFWSNFGSFPSQKKIFFLYYVFFDVDSKSVIRIWGTNRERPEKPEKSELHKVFNNADIGMDHFGIAGICCTANSPGCTLNLPGCTLNLPGCTPNLPRCTPKLIERYNLINESALLS